LLPDIPTPGSTPNTGKETAHIRGITALVSRNFSAPGDLGSNIPSEKNIALTWSENGLGIILEGSFSLEELSKIAESMK
jgi:hypothetical protein